MSTKKPQPQGNTATLDRIEINYKHPSLYNVVLINDNTTTMDFVSQLLMEVFYMNQTDAEIIMLKIHSDGEGICGTFGKDIAISKAALVNHYSKQAKYPLKCIVRKTLK
ncbi:MAG: ATP-dependent Clp protease adaptor ClpS [Gammaproteobacteria bacterium]|nr:MAG: ATP-dependent Clp protease adaptor ClpS [Gammaproteobacteria bacterium]